MSFKKYLNEQEHGEEPTSEPGAGIDIYFNDIDTVAQKKIMDAVMEELNAVKDDNRANKKIVDGFASAPLFTLTPEYITNKIKLENKGY